ncbi:sigma factor-like helix-turn-helix DNA-binding protein [Desnuesiella massiliensis]|uniref:sigma factor-like helix-turn-helix DNA-binding protein n=1 Tax=Desnuesiella massiliensis TaxID=1650662 RepID=UPI0012B50930|nr:sigma factor-like helix-turn-helix DNA-binding protein [Desnuesiella massiliensis]
MKRNEIIELTDAWLKKFNYMKEQINRLDPDIHRKRINLYKLRLRKISKAIGILKEDDQRIICYRYFDELTYGDIVQRVGYSNNTVARRIKKLLLIIGRALLGMEEEFWNEILN